MGSYHTLNIGPGERIEITKDEWPGYIRSMLKDSVEDAKRPKLGVVAIDDEKAAFAYIKGYGVDVFSEIYSKLSKKMKQSEYEKERNKFFDTVIEKMKAMQVDKIIIAGPGFTKDDLKAYMESSGKETGKKVIYADASDTERSGIREALQSSTVQKELESEKINEEFKYLNLFLKGLTLGNSYSGVENVREAIENYDAGIVLVNDSKINDKQVKNLLDEAYMNKVPIKIFNADDDAGMQLKNFGDIVAIGKRILGLDV